MYSYNAHQYPEVRARKEQFRKLPILINDKDSNGEMFYGVKSDVIGLYYAKAAEYCGKPRAETTEDDLKLYLDYVIRTRSSRK